MKTKQLIITLVIILLPAILAAQSASKAIFEKYAEQDGVTSVSISGELLKMLANDDGSVDIQGKSINTRGFNLSLIKSIRLLHVNSNDGINAKILDEILKETEAAFKKDKAKYTELVQIQNGKERVNILALKDKNNVQELIVYHRDNTVNKGTEHKEVTLVYIEGPFEEGVVNNMIKKAMK